MTNHNGSNNSPAAPKPPPYLGKPLTAREQEILGLIHAGLNTEQIATKLWITVGTTKHHKHNIYVKLGVRNRRQVMELMK